MKSIADLMLVSSHISAVARRKAEALDSQEELTCIADS